MKKVKQFFKTIPGKITILALILFGVGFLTYQFYFKNQFAFSENEQIFLDGIKEYLERYPRELPEEGSFKEVSLEEMYNLGWVDTLYVPGKNRVCKEDSFIRVIRNENEKYTYLVSLTCGKYKSKTDNVKPTITLKGDNPLVLHLGDEYTEPGIEKVKDNKDSLKIEDVKIDTSKLDLTKTGTYKVTYQVYDKSFNEAKVEREVIIAETLSRKITTTKGENYAYKGLASDNYVLFSGILFRIVKLNQDKTVMLIAENNIANVLYGSEDYPNSNIYHWLNTYFYEHLSSKSQSYIVDSSWCYDAQLTNTTPNNCTKKANGKVGLLSLNDYLFTKEEASSYLLDNARFMLLNLSDSENLWMSDLNNQESLATYPKSNFVGVRPVINLSSDICITGGNGTYDSPYKLQDYTYGRENDLLSSRLIGEYVFYSGYQAQISNILEDGSIELTSSELMKNQTTGKYVSASFNGNTTIPNPEEEGNLYQYLNNEVINYISEKHLVKREYEIPELITDKKFDEAKKIKINATLSIPASYEMFSGYNKNYTAEDVIYWLSDYQDNNVMILNGNNGIAFKLNKNTFPKNAIKFKMTLKPGLSIASGKGTVKDPYYVR